MELARGREKSDQKSLESNSRNSTIGIAYRRPSESRKTWNLANCAVKFTRIFVCWFAEFEEHMLAEKVLEVFPI